MSNTLGVRRHDVAFVHSDMSPCSKGILFGVASALTVCLTFWLGRALWPPGLPAWAQHIFWPATAVNLAGLLVLGWRYFPWIWLGAPVAVFMLGEPLVFSIIGATGNVLEALLGYFIVRRLGRFSRRFDHSRSVLALMAASFIAPIPATIMVPLWLFVEREMDFRQFGMAIWNWNFSNGTAMILATPFLCLLFRWPSSLSQRRIELVVSMLILLALTFLTIGAVFMSHGENFAFLIFPALILVSVRLGSGGVAVAGAVVMAAIYAALIYYASQMNLGRTPSIIWFTQAFTWVLVSTGLLVAALVAERQTAQRRLINARSRMLSASLREERARLDALRYQMNPHFLFNALNSLRATLSISTEASREMVTELSGYLRATLSRPADNLARVHEEIEMVRQYLAIEQKRFPEELKITISVADALRDTLIPVFLIQPLAENTIVHGLAMSKGCMDLVIEIRTENDQIIMEVANTGVWHSSDSSHPHLGTNNIRNRLKLLYGNKATFTLREESGWVRAVITIPLSSCVA